MPDNGVKYDGNGEDLHNYGDHSSSQPRGRSHGGPDDYIDSKSRHGSRDYGREPSKSSDKERDKVQDKERERDRGRDRNRDYDRHSRDRYMDRGDRRVRGKYSDDYHRSRDFERRRDYDRDREDRHRRKSRSRSPSRSRSRSKSKRTSGFDMAPSTSAMLGGASFVAAGQVSGTTTPIPGMFPNMFPLVSGQFGAIPGMPFQAVTPQATRHARRVYVGGLPPTSNEQSVATFFSQAMAAINGNTAGLGDAVVNVYINYEKKFAFVEMRSVEEASNAMALDGIIFEDVSVTDDACKALTGIKMGDKILTVRRANQGASQPKPEEENILFHAQQQIALQRFLSQPGALAQPSEPATKVVCLTEVVSADDLKDDEEYEDIMVDMREEGEKFGALVNVIIPRPKPSGEPSPGVGKVFLEYGDTEGAVKARSSLNGRKFGGSPVVAVFYPEDKFFQGEYDS